MHRHRKPIRNETDSSTPPPLLDPDVRVRPALCALTCRSASSGLRLSTGRWSGTRTETAISPPEGGFEIAWGGEPLNERHGPNRVCFVLVADSLEAEVERLAGLGASPNAPRTTSRWRTRRGTSSCFGLSSGFEARFARTSTSDGE